MVLQTVREQKYQKTEPVAVTELKCFMIYKELNIHITYAHNGNVGDGLEEKFEP
jgi:hypothetical protein